MRDFNRIDRILNLLGEIWKKHPDQRMGQLLINYGLINDNMESWNIEDDEMEAQLKFALSNVNKK